MHLNGFSPLTPLERCLQILPKPVRYDMDSEALLSNENLSRTQAEAMVLAMFSQKNRVDQLCIKNRNEFLDIKSEEGLKALLEQSINFKGGLKHLSFVNCRFTKKTWEILCRRLSYFIHLDHLEFDGCTLDTIAVKELVEHVLMFLKERLVSFRLANNQMSGASYIDHLRPFFAHNRTLYKLDLSGNELGDSEVFLLVFSLRTTEIEKLILDDNEVTDSAIDNMYLQKLLKSTHYSFKGNKISTKALNTVITFLQEDPLRNFYLDGNQFWSYLKLDEKIKPRIFANDRFEMVLPRNPCERS